MDHIPFELSALSNAVKYQAWIYQSVEPYLGQRILEVGAGIGNMSRWLPRRERLILTESDPGLFSRLRSIPEFSSDSRISVQKFDLSSDSVDAFIAENIDTIVSFNVLEHIEDDAEALKKLRQILIEGKGPCPRRLVTFIPAHDWAYGTLDQAFGHFRRYSRESWQKLHQKVAPEAKLTVKPFNVCGLLGWVLNGRVLRKTKISDESLELFEKLCPVMKQVDKVAHGWLNAPVGQSLVSVLEWR